MHACLIGTALQLMLVGSQSLVGGGVQHMHLVRVRTCMRMHRPLGSTRPTTDPHIQPFHGVIPYTWGKKS